MSEITFNCPKCQQELEAPIEMAGATVECPNCNQPMIVPAPVVEDSALDAISINETSTPSMSSVPNVFGNIEEHTDEETANLCPECGATMQKNSVLCLKCGFHTGLGKKISTDLG